MAISRGSVDENKRLATDKILDFPILSDPDMALIKSLGMVHEKAGPGGQDAARPATYILDRHGRVRWLRTAGKIRTRPDPNEVLGAVKLIH